MAPPTSLIRTIAVEVLHDGQQRLFRVCGDREASGFEDAFRSHYDLRRPPRGPENRVAAIHMALSMFDRIEVAADLARRVPKLGGHVATLDLVADLGICVAKTGGPAHWSVWSRPAQVIACVTNVVRIGG